MTDDAIAKALCDVKFSQIEGNGRKFRHIEIASSVKFSNSVAGWYTGCLQQYIKSATLYKTRPA